MATLYDRSKHWSNVPDEHRGDILVYLGHVLHSYVDAGKEPPDYLETKQMLEQEGYSRQLITEQKGKIRSMLWQTHKLFEKEWGQGSLNFPGMTTRKAYGPNKQGPEGPPKGGKRKRRKTRKTKKRKTKKRKTLKKRNRKSKKRKTLKV